MSLELLLKLVACFGPTICSTISAPPSVGVDLHQEERYIPQSSNSAILITSLSLTWKDGYEELVFNHMIYIYI